MFDGLKHGFSYEYVQMLHAERLKDAEALRMAEEARRAQMGPDRGHGWLKRVVLGLRDRFGRPVL